MRLGRRAGWAACRGRWMLALALLAGPYAGPARSSPPDVQVETLPNGLKVLLAPDSLAAAVDVSVWYRAGTRFEPAGMSGITHLMERWMFRGSPHYGPGEHARLVLAEGGVASTFTTSDASCFFDTVPAEALELTLKLEADRMGTLSLTAEGLERERRIARGEQERLAAAGPVGLGLRSLRETAFPGHPYGWPAGGREQDLGRVTLTACQAYQRAHYAPGNAVLLVVGRFDPAQALSLVRRHFGPIKSRPAPATKPPALAPQQAERRGLVRVQGSVPVLMVGWRAPGGADRSAAALDLLARLLGSGPRSRLAGALMRPPGMCLAVEGGFDDRRDASLLYVAAVVRPGADTAMVEQALLAVTADLAATPLPSAELDALKREAELALLLDREPVRGRAQSLGTAEAVLGDYRRDGERFQRLRELTPEDVRKTAADVLGPEGRSVVWVVPGGAGSTGASGKGAAR